ncbi:GGDEF domain-containing protein [Dethiothermospora halolimnae]|uniref:GGDEF domain-containing protein n=1 Tax=Dethiothermospora halolimnae TaxID=3114390 RepID=UPI003CCBFD8D
MRYQSLSKDDLIIKLRQRDKEVKRLKKIIKKIKKEATKDYLTSALNRRAGIEVLNREIRDSRTNGGQVTICYIDVDGLKKINDQFGHLEGDKLLKDISDLIRKNIRSTDILIRLGGDEFLLVFPKTNINGAKKVWDRVYKSIKLFNKIEANSYNIALSYGFAQYSRDKYTSLVELIKTADNEMYKRKSYNK